jgi:uncharacterized protein YjiS (DUF1127 family)
MFHLSSDRSHSGRDGGPGVFAGFAQNVGALLRGLPAQVVRWHKHRQGLAALRALSDRQLRDIGICRAEIAMVAYGLADPREAAAAEAAGGAAMRPVPQARKADNGDERPIAGSCAA